MSEVVGDLCAGAARRIFNYNPQTGEFTRVRSTQRRFVGKCGSKDRNGHLQVWIGSKIYSVHRLIWLIMTGSWPEKPIDHIDGNPLNNRWSNLRLASMCENAANRKCHKNNALQIKGVRRMGSKYQVRISPKGKTIHVGSFDCPAAAAIAYQIASDIHFKEFARFK